MGLSADEKKLLEELNRKAQEPDAEDFEIEVWDHNKGTGARLPFSKGSKWLYDQFGIGEAPASSAAGEPPAGGEGTPAQPPAGEGNTSKNSGYFGGRRQQ